MELRTIRMELEGLAAEAAALRIIPETVDAMEQAHAALVAAEEAADAIAANRSNWTFHHMLYSAAAMPELLALIEGIWLRNGPMLARLYPDARPTYPGRHRHLDVLEGLRARSPSQTRKALAADLVEGGAKLISWLEKTDREAAFSSGP